MPDIIISDASCLIALDNIHQFELLKKIYKHIYTTPQVASEFGALPEWVIIIEPKNKEAIRKLEIILDTGEASAIALAMEHTNCTLLIDEKLGRKVAMQSGIHITGTLGVVLRAKKEGHISSISAVLKMLKNIGFHFNHELEQKLLTDAGEDKES